MRESTNRWVIAIGAIGLVGVADVLGGDRAAAASLVATLSTMVAIAELRPSGAFVPEDLMFEVADKYRRA